MDQRSQIADAGIDMVGHDYSTAENHRPPPQSRHTPDRGKALDTVGFYAVALRSYSVHPFSFELYTSNTRMFIPMGLIGITSQFKARTALFDLCRNLATVHLY